MGFQEVWQQNLHSSWQFRLCSEQVALKLFKFGLAFTPMQVFLLLLGMIVSFAVSVIAIKFLMKYIKNHDFKAFGYYRIVLGIIVFLFFGIQALFK